MEPSPFDENMSSTTDPSGLRNALLTKNWLSFWSDGRSSTARGRMLALPMKYSGEFSKSLSLDAR